MNIQKLRGLFEAAYEARSFARNGRFDRAVLTRGGDDEYIIPQVQSAWWGWQASREILRVTNPFPVQMGDPDAAWAREVAEKSLRSQGLKVVG
ncbi:hypothetical protein ACCE15_09080 [Pseudomonas parafulva]|uniref:hypothetical protein n=1 Tax=Pseudomonas parafulva TaxID=157782 RepID=UPI00356662C2